MSQSTIIFEDMVIKYSTIIGNEQLKSMLTAVLNAVDRMPDPYIGLPKTTIIIPSNTFSAIEANKQY